MHSDFADWYRPCTTGTEVNLTGDLLTKRWGGIEKATKSPGHEVLDLVRVALGRAASPTFLSKFRAAFKETDVTFQMSGNEFELQVLAGSALCWMFHQEDDEADEASLALLSAVGITKPPEGSEPFVSHADAYLDRRLRGIRQPPTIRPPQFAAKKLKGTIDAYVAKLPENNLPQTADTVKQLGDAILQAFTGITEASTTAINELARQSELRREETDVLWWLTAAVSRDLGVTFNELKTPAAAIVAGKELADLVSPPGILPAKSILQSFIPAAIGKAAGKPVALNAAVNATTAEWRGALVRGLAIDPITDLCPVLAAVKHSLTTDDADTWTAAYKKAYCLDPKAALEPVELAHQLYRESLLARLAAAG